MTAALSCLREHPPTAPRGGGGGPRRDERGLTLFELVVTVTISAILSGIAVVSYGNALHRARVGKAIAEIRLIEREIAKYEIDHGGIPDSLERIRWRTGDPWGHPYQYLRIEFKDDDNGGDGNGNGGGGNGSGGGGGGQGGGGNGNGGGGGGNGSGQDPDDSGGCPGGRGHPSGARKDRFLVPINCDYDLYSMGPDGETTAPLTAKKSRDDIIRANDGAYVGPASEF